MEYVWQNEQNNSTREGFKYLNHAGYEYSSFKQLLINVHLFLRILLVLKRFKFTFETCVPIIHN